MHNVLIQGFFHLNQTRIAQTICVEKDIEDSKCGGCCQLKKSLAKENTEEGAIPTEQKQSEMVVQAIEISETNKFPKFADERDLLWPIEKSGLVKGVLNAVYQPPDAC